jgi:glycolate oxidase iron-sulfur subunit
MAERLLHRKVNHIVETGAQAVITANPGCILQIQQGLRARGCNVKVFHIVEILNQAYGG